MTINQMTKYKAIMCFNCRGSGKVSINTQPVDLSLGAMFKIAYETCSMCDGHTCLWVTPLLPKEKQSDNE